jgi:hypothetical protein
MAGKIGGSMNKNEAIKVGFKVLSMYAFMQGITALGIPISIYEITIPWQRLQGSMGTGSDTFSAAVFLPSALLFLFGGLLWLSAKRIKVSSTDQESTAENGIGLTPQILQRIIFSALGIFIVVGSVAPLGNIVTALNLHDRRVFVQNPVIYYRIADGLLQLIFGCWLIIGSKGLRKFQSWLLEM